MGIVYRLREFRRSPWNIGWGQKSIELVPANGQKISFKICFRRKWLAILFSWCTCPHSFASARRRKVSRRALNLQSLTSWIYSSYASQSAECLESLSMSRMRCRLLSRLCEWNISHTEFGILSLTKFSMSFGLEFSVANPTVWSHCVTICFRVNW